MKLALVTLGLGLAQLLGLAAAACPSVAIKTRSRVVVGKNTTLTVKVSNAWNKGQTAVTDGILTVTLPPGFAYAAGTKRSSPQPSVSDDTLTWSNLNFATGKRSQVFQVVLSTNGCADGTHPQSIQASVTSALQSCTKSAKPKAVRAKYTTKSPTDCEPPVPPGPVPPGCEVRGVWDLGVNPFTLIQTGVSLLTDPATCDFTTAIQGANVYSFTAPSTGCFSFSTCDQIWSDLAMSIVEVCGDPATQIACIDDTCGLAFEIIVPMVSGNTYSVYLGAWCNDDLEDRDDPDWCNAGVLDPDDLDPRNTITVSSVPCD